jgi:hypothetical protein
MLKIETEKKESHELNMRKKDPKDFFGMDSGMKAWQRCHFLYLLGTP